MSTPSSDAPAAAAEADDQLRTHAVLVRLTEDELQELLAQQAELATAERRSVSRAEVLRRRAWGLLPVRGAA